MTKKALVLGGGGAKGSYEMGAWKAFRELGLSFDIIVGTSIGALNGALMTQDTYEAAEELWDGIEYKNIFGEEREKDIRYINNTLDMVKFAVNDAIMKGSVDSKPLETLVKKSIDEEKVRKGKNTFGLVAVELPALRPFMPMINEIPHGTLYKYLMASSACFPVFSPYAIDGISYIDGGYYDNVPINLAIEQGATDIVAVDLDGVGFVKEPKASKKINTMRINSYWDLGAVFDFDKNVFARNRFLGYHETMKAFGRFEGWYYTFKKGEIAKNHSFCQRGIKEFVQRIKALKHRPLAKTIRAIEKDSVIEFLSDADWGTQLPQMLCQVAEMAGVVYGVTPERVYSFDEFNAKLLDCYALQPSVLEDMKKIQHEDIKHILAAVLQTIESKSIAASITQLLLRYNDSEAIKALAGLLPREYAAACYMQLLLINTKGTETLQQ